MSIISSRNKKIFTLILDMIPIVSKKEFNSAESNFRLTHFHWVKGIIDVFCLSNSFRHENDAWIYGVNDSILIKIDGNSVRYINPESRSLAMLLKQALIAYNSDYKDAKMPLGFKVSVLNLLNIEKLIQSGMYYDSSGILLQKAIESCSKNKKDEPVHIIFDQRRVKKNDLTESLIPFRIENEKKTNFFNQIILVNYYFDEYSI